MDFLLNRYRNLTVLLVVIVVQLLLLAYQVKTNKDVPLMRVWAVSTVTPVEEALEFVRHHTFGVASDYFVLVHVREDNEKLQKELDRLKLENHYLTSQLSTADRMKLLDTFRQQTPSKTLGARAIGNGTGANSKTIFVDRGSAAGVQNGMAVITPDGIVGKIVAAYPTASLVMLMTDPSFAAGVISQKNHVHGTLKGMGGPKCRVDYVQNEEKVEPGEWFYTAGDDGIFPRGFPAGQVASVESGRTSKQIIVTPAGWTGGVDEVLIVTEGIHQPIPEPRMAAAPVKILPPPIDQSNTGVSQNTASLSTDADKLRQEYKQVGEQEKIQFGATGTKPPDFSKVGKAAAPPVQPPAPNQPSGQPSGQPLGQPKTQALVQGQAQGVPGVAKVPVQNQTASTPAAIPPANPRGSIAAPPPTGTVPLNTRNAATGLGSTSAPVNNTRGSGAAPAPNGTALPVNARSAATGTGSTVVPANNTRGSAATPNGTVTPANTRSSVSGTVNAPNKTPARPRAPILETDPTDADLVNEAVAERVQRERSNAKVVYQDKNTEILAPASPPKSKPAAPKNVPAKTPGPATP